MKRFDQLILKTNQEIYSPVLTEGENLDALRGLFTKVQYLATGGARTTAKGYAPDNVFVLINGYKGLEQIYTKLKEAELAAKTNQTAAKTNQTEDENKSVPQAFAEDGTIQNPDTVLKLIYTALSKSAEYDKHTPHVTVNDIIRGGFRSVRQAGQYFDTNLGVNPNNAFLEIQKLVNNMFPNQLVYMTSKDVDRFRMEKEKGEFGDRVKEWGAGKIMKGVEGVKTDIKSAGEGLKPTTF